MSNAQSPDDPAANRSHRRVWKVAVEGTSMLPTLAPDERLLVLPLPPRRGRLVVVGDPRGSGRLLVKRVRAVTRDGVLVTGDNAHASTDSRAFGVVPRRLVRGRPVYRYHPASQAGWLWRA